MNSLKKFFALIVVMMYCIVVIFSPELTSDVMAASTSSKMTPIVVKPAAFSESKGTVFSAEKALDRQSSSYRDDAFSLNILHTNDTHAHVEQYPRLFTAVNEIRDKEEYSLLVNAGDVFTGTLYFLKYLGQADFHFMNQLGFDAMTLGNHEFDKDSETLANFIKNMKFPMVSSNVQVKLDPKLGPLFTDKIEASAEGGKIYPAIIKEYGDEKVGIIGLTTQDAALLANPEEHIAFEDPVEKAQETIDLLESKGIDKIVVLSHLGYSADQKLAKNVSGIDVIVGGHSHTALEKPVVIGKREPTLIVQTGGYLNSLGVLRVTFDTKGIITSHKGKLLSLEDYEEDPKAVEMLSRFKEPLREVSEKVIGKTSVVLDGERSDIRYKETNLGNLIADAMVEKANENIKTHIAMYNSGGIRTSIPKGDITLGQVITVLPFENNLVVLNLTGEEIWQALENSVSEADDGEGKFAQVSGIKFKYDINQPPGKRVWQVEVKTEDGYEQVGLKKFYNVATVSFIADGGLGYTMFKKAKDEGRITELLIADSKVFVSYLKKHSPVKPRVEGRIIQKGNKNSTFKNLPLEKPIVHKITDQSIVVYGKTDAEDAVKVKIGEDSYTGEADEQGVFQIFIPEQKAGTLISVIATDHAGTDKVPTDIVVKDETPPEAPKLEEVRTNSKRIKGTAEKNSIITVTIDKKTFISKANRKGQFQVKIPTQAAGTVIVVTAKDKAGNESKPAETITKK